MARTLSAHLLHQPRLVRKPSDQLSRLQLATCRQNPQLALQQTRLGLLIA
jgi:hypothetical protein